MARYRKIDTRIWNDERFAQLSDDAKLVFLFLLTHPHLTSLGAMRATLPGLAAELGWPVERFRKAFERLLTDSQRDGQALVEHDDRACFVGLPKFLKYNSPENGNVVKSWGPLLDMLPECSHKTRLLGRIRDHVRQLGGDFARGWERVCPTLSEGFAEPFGNGMPNPEPEPEPKPEQEPEPNPKSLSSPDGDGSKGAKGSKIKGKRKSAPKFSDDDLKLAQDMFAGIQQLNADAKLPDFNQWANEMRLLRSDGNDRTAENIRATLAWVRQDSFWKSNVLCPAKLREKWDQLQLKRKSQNESRTTSGKPDGLYREAAHPGRRTF